MKQDTELKLLFNRSIEGRSRIYCGKPYELFGKKYYPFEFEIDWEVANNEADILGVWFVTTHLGDEPIFCTDTIKVKWDDLSPNIQRQALEQISSDAEDQLNGLLNDEGNKL